MKWTTVDINWCQDSFIQTQTVESTLKKTLFSHCKLFSILCEILWWRLPLTMLPLTVDNMTFFHSEIFTTCQIELFPFCTRVMILYCTYQLHLTCHDTMTQRQVLKRTSQTVGTLKTRIWVHSVWLKGKNGVWEKNRFWHKKKQVLLFTSAHVTAVRPVHILPHLLLVFISTAVCAHAYTRHSWSVGTHVW